MFLRKSFSLEELAWFLQWTTYTQSHAWTTYDIRSALEGSLSILYVPEDDDHQIHPYHASFQDFLRDKDRSGDHFLDPAINHEIIFHTSARLISNDTDFFAVSGQIVSYAYHNWCFHLLSLMNHNNANIDRSTIEALEALMEMLSQNCCARLSRFESHETVKSWLANLEEVIIAWTKVSY